MSENRLKYSQIYISRNLNITSSAVSEQPASNVLLWHPVSAVCHCLGSFHKVCNSTSLSKISEISEHFVTWIATLLISRFSQITFVRELNYPRSKDVIMIAQKTIILLNKKHAQIIFRKFSNTRTHMIFYFYNNSYQKNEDSPLGM